MPGCGRAIEFARAVAVFGDNVEIADAAALASGSASAALGDAVSAA